MRLFIFLIPPSRVHISASVSSELLSVHGLASAWWARRGESNIIDAAMWPRVLKREIEFVARYPWILSQPIGESYYLSLPWILSRNGIRCLIEK